MRAFILAGCLAVAAPALFAAEPEGRAPQPAVAARVNGEPISVAEIEAEVRQALKERPVPADQTQELLRRAREQAIDRRLVLGFLSRAGFAPSKADIDFALAQLEKQLTAQDRTLDAHCRELGLSVEDVRGQLAWKLAWSKYLEKMLTAANLEKYFERHRAEYDGTELRVAHILIAPASPAAEEKARAIAQSIAEGELSFELAAKKHSSAPTGKTGGDIGWIERRQPMPEEFSKAAFALKPGEVSPPVQTAFGWHLIQVLEVKSGQRTWQEAAAELRPAATLFLFRRLADSERKTARIEREQNWP